MYLNWQEDGPTKVANLLLATGQGMRNLPVPRYKHDTLYLIDWPQN